MNGVRQLLLSETPREMSNQMYLLLLSVRYAINSWEKVALGAYLAVLIALALQAAARRRNGGG
jgi:hypothetical protein